MFLGFWKKKKYSKQNWSNQFVLRVNIIAKYNIQRDNNFYYRDHIAIQFKCNVQWSYL